LNKGPNAHHSRRPFFEGNGACTGTPRSAFFDLDDRNIQFWMCDDIRRTNFAAELAVASLKHDDDVCLRGILNAMMRSKHVQR
jgi:hypothetical protein